MSLRSIARKIKLGLVHGLQGLSLRLSSPHDFLSEALSRLPEPDFVNYLATQGGADRLFDSLRETMRNRLLLDYLARHGAIRWLNTLYELAGEDAGLTERLARTELGDVFGNFYFPLFDDPGMRSYLVERGVDDLYRYVYLLAQKADLPLAQRSECYGQEGEDLIIGRLFGGRRTGFFVDVGAHHPFRFSNTWLLYKRGWRGINIDAMPGAMTAFREWRPEDTNIECLISNDTRPRTFFQYEEPALNTLSEDMVRQRERDAPHYRLTGSIVLPARRLADILASHLPSGQAIDLLNVDVEGHDLDVLISNDWERFRPELIVVELIGTAHAEMEKSELYRFLEARGYRLQSKLVNSAIFAQVTA